MTCRSIQDSPAEPQFAEVELGAAEHLGSEIAVDRRVLSYVVESINTVGYAPTLREIQRGCALRSLRSAQESLLRLERRGLVRTVPKQARGLAIASNLLPETTSDGSALLRLFSVATHGLYPHMCRAAALAPSREAAEGWLRLTIDRLRQVSAVDEAIDRREATHGPIDAETVALVDHVWDAYAEFTDELHGWVDWLIMEEFDARLVMQRGFGQHSIPERGTTATVLEGHFEIAITGRRFVDAELSRLERGAHDLDRFNAEVADARNRISAFHHGIEGLLDLVWQSPMSHPLEMP